MQKVIDHLNLLYNVAPDRVGIFGLIVQEETTNHIKPIYVHSKLALIDDNIMLNGSTNMDNISFYYCSEVSIAVQNPALVKSARIRLGKEHLGPFWRNEMEHDYVKMFDGFCRVASENMLNLRKGLSPSARPIWMAPAENYDFLLKTVYYPNKFSKLMNKMGVNTHQFTESLSSLPGATTLVSSANKIKAHL